MNKFIRNVSMWLGVLALTACAAYRQPTDDTPVMASAEQAAQKQRSDQQLVVEHIARLAAAVREQPRDETWAVSKEKQLRQSFATAQAGTSQALRRVDCRRSLCELDLELRAEPARATAARSRAAAIDQWIAWSQPCAYTLTQQAGAEGASTTVRVYLDCGQ